MDDRAIAAIIAVGILIGAVDASLHEAWVAAAILLVLEGLFAYIGKVGS